MAKDKNIEIRNTDPLEAEIRISGNKGRNVIGHAVVFNSESRDLGGFREIILPEAVDGVLNSSDVLALLNHSVERGVLARAKNGKGTLKLEVDDKGVKYDFESPNTNLGDEVVEGIKRGDITTSSFAFSVAPNGDKWEKRKDGTYLRTVLKFDKIYDVSAVYREAYEDTDVAVRSLDELKKENIIIITPVIDGEKLKITLENNLEPLEILEPELKVEPETKPIIEEPIIEPIVREEPIVEEPVIEQRNINLKNNNMPTIKEFQDLKATAIEENDKIYALKDAEKRTMTSKEEEIVKMNNQKIKEWELQMETEVRKVGSERFSGPYVQSERNEQFSLLKTIRAQAEKREIPGAARDVSILGRQEFAKSGINVGGDIVLPCNPRIFRRASPILAGEAGQGQEIVAEDKKAILPPLVDTLVFGTLGTTFMTGLVGNVSIPSYTGTTVEWQSEVAPATELEGTFAEINLSPKRITAYLLVSKTFLAQDGVGAERLLLDNIANAVARHIEATILGVGDSSVTQPAGMGYLITSGGTGTKAVNVPTYASMVALESAVDVANALAGNLAYVTNAAGRGILKSIDKGVSNDTGDMLCSENNMVNGYKLVVTNSCSSAAGTETTGELLVFGNWADLVIAQWGGYDITVDPYTAAGTNQVKITINAFVDVANMRGVTGDGTGENAYWKSFARDAIVIAV